MFFLNMVAFSVTIFKPKDRYLRVMGC